MNSSKNKVTYIDVAFGLPKGPFTYSLSLDNGDPVKPGVRVTVPFRSSVRTGYVVSESSKPSYQTKAVKEVLDSEPVISSELLSLAIWLSDYYQCSVGESLDTMVPAAVRQGRAVPATAAAEATYDSPPFHHVLTPDQQSVFDTIVEPIRDRVYKGFLLCGVTGSGKSEVYVRLINETLQQGRSVICLVPEIALTVHLQQYFAQHFSQHLEILHSKMTQSERFKAWKRIRSRTASLVIGPRSAIFSPVQNLGLVVMDEEHENSYKQEDTPRYHAREVAERLTQEARAVFLMGTATPSLEARVACDHGRYTLLHLDKRIVQDALPEVRVIDLKNEMTRGGNLLISRPLKRAIEDTLGRKEQIVLFINRRGYATCVSCLSCGEVCVCKSCQVSLTYHAQKKELVCHYCNYRIPVPGHCLSCGSKELKFGGIGTERVEGEVKKMFPSARIERLDTDRVRKRGEAEKIITDFSNGKIDVLIGTQMLAKGFDFPHVTLVGVINADSMLSLPDFRASERSFQLITQVAGRTGRGTKGGSVVLQTFMPENYAVQCARNHDYEAFYERERAYREALSYPPFTQLINIILRSRGEAAVEDAATELAAKLTPLCCEGDVELLGPAPLPFYKLRNYYRWHIMLRGKNPELLRACAEKARTMFSRSRTVYSAVDVDPVSIL